MAIDPQAIFSKRIRFSSFALSALLGLYLGFSCFLFFQWVKPSLDGRTDQHIAADSGTYLYFADSLREGRNDPLVLSQLTTFPNNLWSPVLMALIFKSIATMAIANIVLFFISIFLFKKSYSFSTATFIFLLLINPTTTVSLLSVNKEIVDMLAISMFCYALQSGKKAALVVSLIFALVNRYEVCIVMLLFLFFQSRLNPWRAKRLKVLSYFVLAISVLLPTFASSSLAARFEEASNGGVVKFLDGLEMHYFYMIAVIPKIAESLFGELLNVSNWKNYRMYDLANSYILWFNNLANAIVVCILCKRRSLTLADDIVYLAVLGSILMAISLVIQPRYFYFVYVLLCLRVAHYQPARRRGRPILRDFSEVGAHA